MKMEINGIKREVQIMQAPQGSYYCDEGSEEPLFPMYIGMCEPITKDEEWYTSRGVLLVPIIGNCYKPYEGIERIDILNDVSLYDLQELIPKYAFENECDNLKEVVEQLMDLFEIHKTPIRLSVRKYVSDVMNGTITKIPNNG